MQEREPAAPVAVLKEPEIVDENLFLEYELIKSRQFYHRILKNHKNNLTRKIQEKNLKSNWLIAKDQLSSENLIRKHEFFQIKTEQMLQLANMDGFIQIDNQDERGEDE